MCSKWLAWEVLGMREEKIGRAIESSTSLPLERQTAGRI
jgi:hypothetical protein